MTKQLTVWDRLESRRIALARGENYKFLSTLNAEHRFFENIIPLAHPRFIMQYKRKNLNKYLDQYIEAFHHS
jgi:hypothetical protein